MRGIEQPLACWACLSLGASPKVPLWFARVPVMELPVSTGGWVTGPLLACCVTAICALLFLSSQVRKGIHRDGKLNPDIVGQSVQKLSELFGIKVPSGTKVLIGETSVIGPTESLSQEKLCPILAMYKWVTSRVGVG